MNKKISAVLISALMVLTMFTALVPSASAAITVAPPYEFIGVVNQTPVPPEFFNISATSAVNPSILYYDLDDLDGDETLKMFTYDGDELTIGEGNLTYSTSTWVDDGNTFVAWLGEKYYVVENTTSKWIISDLIVDEDDTDDHLLRVGETLTLAEGWSLTALEIDVEGKKAWISLSKDGEEVENKVVKEAGSDTAAGTGYFVYEEDLEATDDTEVMNFTVETVFAGMNTNLVKINDIDLISLDTLEIKSGDDDVVEDYDVKQMTATKITVDNADDISLSEDGIVDIMGGRFSVRVTDGKTLAAVCRILTEPGTYELIGSVNDSETGKFFKLHAESELNPSVLFYDLDDLDGAETLDMFTLDGDELTIGEGNLTYTTSTWVDESNTFVAWLGEKYYVVENTTSKWIISDLIVDEDDTDDHLLRVGETLTLAEGWSLTALEIDVEGKKAWISLSKDGEEVENKVVKEAGSDTAAGTGYFVFEEDLEATDDTEVMNFTVETVFAGMNTNLVKINDIDLISLDTLEIKSGDDDVVEDYDVKSMSATMIEVTNDDDISLSEDGIVDIMGDRFAVRVTEDKTLAAIAKIIIIEGDVVATSTSTPTGNETVTATVPGDEPGTVDGTVVGTAPPVEPVPTPTPTDTPAFEAVFAVAGLLAVAYLVLRQRD